MDLLAVIVAMKGDQVLRVSCKTCKKDRNYRAPRSIEGATPVPKASRKSNQDKSASVSIESYHKQVMQAALGNPTRDYTITSAYLEGDVVHHPTFGPGVVQKVIPPKKMEVVFERDIKTLMCGGKRETTG